MSAPTCAVDRAAISSVVSAPVSEAVRAAISVVVRFFAWVCDRPASAAAATALICTADIAPKAAEDIALRSDDVSVAACADVIAWTLAAMSEPAAAVVRGQTTKDALETVVMTIPFAAPRRARKTLRWGGGEGRRHDAG